MRGRDRSCARVQTPAGRLPEGGREDWYVVHTRARKEAFVRDRIEDLGCEAFLPLLRQRRPRTRSWTEQPLFPNYLFARLSAGEGDLPRVRWTQGVRRLLGDGADPRPVPDSLVDTIRARVDRRGRLKRTMRLRHGERVRIVDGPLAGLVGVLERPPASAGERVRVLLELFDRLTLVELAAGDVWAVASE